MRYKHKPVEKVTWYEINSPVSPVYPRTGARIMLFFPPDPEVAEPAHVVFATYDKFSNWVPRPTHWAKMVEGPEEAGAPDLPREEGVWA